MFLFSHILWPHDNSDDVHFFTTNAVYNHLFDMALVSLALPFNVLKGIALVFTLPLYLTEFDPLLGLMINFSKNWFFILYFPMIVTPDSYLIVTFSYLIFNCIKLQLSFPVTDRESPYFNIAIYPPSYIPG